MGRCALRFPNLLIWHETLFVVLVVYGALAQIFTLGYDGSGICTKYFGHQARGHYTCVCTYVYLSCDLSESGGRDLQERTIRFRGTALC